MPDMKVLDMLERAYNAGCFREVLKMIKAGTSEVIIEKIIQKFQQKNDLFDWDNFFGCD